MPFRSLPSIPLLRKPRFPGSPSTRDVKPEYKYLVRAHRRLRAQETAAKSFTAKFANERAEERECRIQEEVIDYHGTDQSPKRKAVESTTIRSLTRSLCSLSLRARPTPFVVSFDEAMDVDLEIDPDSDMDDSSFDMDVDVDTKDTTPPPPPTTMSQLAQLMSALYVSTPAPPPPPPSTTMSELVQLMSVLYVSTPPPPPYIPTPAPAPSFPPGLHVPAAEASKAAMAEEAVPLGSASVANGAASKGKAAQIHVPWNILFQQLRASRDSEQDDDEGWLV